MKISRSQEQGSVLVSALIILGLIGLTLIATMDMVSSQRTVIARAQTWNSAIPMCEAGIEDALAHINYSGTTNLGSDGWTYTGTNYWRSNNFSGGYYTVAIATSVPPVIVCQGFVLPAIDTNYITRTVQVNTRQNGLFPDALLAKTSILLSGGATIDSFNSTNPAYSTFGKYDSTKAEANAQVDCLSSGSAAIAVGDGIISGYVDTGPGGTVTIDQGIVGDKPFVNNSGNATKIESGHSAANVNTIIPDVVLPNLGSTLSFVSGTISGTNYPSGVLQGGNYVTNGNFAIQGSSKMCVTAPSTLYVSGTFTVGGSGFIYITPGASLTLYVGGSTCSISGAGIVNGGQNSPNCSIWCLPACTTVTSSGSAGFIGTIYAPEAACTFSGGTAVCGAFVGQSIVISGSGAIHYDEVLGGPVGYKYLVASWQEN